MNSTVSQSTLNATFNITDELDHILSPEAGLFIPANEGSMLTPEAIEVRKRNAPWIYPEMVQAASAILKKLLNGNVHPTLLAEPGQGKSGVITWTIIGFLRWLEHKFLLLSTRPQVFWLTLIGDNDLRDQTMHASIRPAGLEPYVETFHVSNFPNKQTQTQSWVNNILEITNYNPEDPETPRRLSQVPRYVLLILDECHLALKRKGALDRLQKTIGIDLSVPKEQWKNQFVQVLDVSATAFPQDLQTVRGSRRPPSTSGLHEYVILAKNPNYLGVAELVKQNRLRNNAGVNYTKNDYHEFRKLVRDGIQAHEESYNKTYRDDTGYPVSAAKNTMVFRVPSREKAKEYARIVEDEVMQAASALDASPIAKLLKGKLRLTLFHHQKAHGELPSEGSGRLTERVIGEFAPALATPDPTHPFNAFFIINAAKAGKVLRGPSLSIWVDMTGKQTDTVVQSVGRGCGYGKERETYLIYCNLKEVEKYLHWYDTVELDVASEVTGTHTKISKVRTIRATALVFHPTLSEMDQDRVDKGYRPFGLDRRMVRNIDQIGKRTLKGFSSKTAAEQYEIKDRLEGYLREMTVGGVGRTINPNAEDESVFYFPPNWNGQFHDNMEQHCGEILAQYRSKINTLYNKYGSGYYWYEPTEYHDSRQHASTSILAAVS